MALAMIGFLGFFACLIWIVVCLIRRKPKKPAVIGLLVCFALFIIGAMTMPPSDKTADSGKETPSQADSSPEAVDTLPVEESEGSEEIDERSAARAALDEVLGGSPGTFYRTVRNDVTGNWRLFVYYSAESIADHAAEYYNAYVESESETHIVVNLGLKTTTVINIYGNLLNIDVHEYIDGEEHDAKILGGGTLLESHSVDLSTGQSEIISTGSSQPQGQGTIDLDTLMAVLRVTIAQNFGENNYTLEYDKSGATISLWGDGIAAGAVLAATGDADAKAAWSTMIDGQTSFCNSVVGQVESIGLENYLVMVNVLNDMDRSKTLLSIMNGVVIYDAVNG